MQLLKLVRLLLSLGKHHQGHVPGEGEGEDRHQETRQAVTRSVSFLSKANLAVNGQKIIPPPPAEGAVVQSKSGLLSAAKSASGVLVKAGKAAGQTYGVEQGLEREDSVIRMIQRRDAEPPATRHQEPPSMLLLDLS